ncbi:Transcriptional regulator, AraC [Romboutsia ilealis]|uniref:Transcriptional regulator, AraC n=2 Tax=Romboutsia ilealis TaxID=1115758 RepID=A0A1V1I5F9_9FIRM|nr:response regulator transcription factor [Romboutsia ilealis]CED94844.1 Transcriptional regulator, AraC [Romboutsia ilealis]
MTNEKTINLLKDMLDITLDLPLFYIEDIKNNLKEIEKYLPSLLTINKDYFNNFIDFIITTKEQNIYSITDSIFANYVVVCLDEINKNYILLGPYLLIADYKDLLSEYNQYDLTLDEINALKNYHKDLPILNKHKISNIVKIILKNIYTKNCKFKFIEKNNLFNLKSKESKTHRELISFIESDYLEKISATEYKLFFAIRQGDKLFASKCFDKLLPQTNINSNDFVNIRDYKNKLIYYNTLLKKAGELEGISTVHLQSLYNTNLDKIELSNDFNELYNLIFNMIVDYCDTISDHKLKYYSPLVKKAINHINLNLNNDLCVKDLADLFYVSPTYLARLFKKEVNSSIVEYINTQRIKQSTCLLKDRNLPIHQISQMVGISDYNYFSRLFKKYMNKTPSQYRKNNT